jgi:CDP-2,3-bis-(O-geranylgeranyl)-sn-glycerol synthase
MLDLLVFLIPVYIANSSPVVLGGGAPLDFGIVLSDGRRIFGRGKTIRGFAGGVLAGTLAGGLVALFYQLPYFSGPGAQFMAAFLLSVGTLTGDAFGSFLKRRLGIESGSQFMPDTFIFLVVSLIFVFPLADASLFALPNLAFFLILTVILHPLTNIIANRLGLKKVPW